jgi:dipeptidyl-peptidase 4
MLIRALIFLLACCAFSLPAERLVTIDDVAGYRRADHINPVWSPDGRSFAYAQNNAIYLYQAAERKKSVWFKLESLEEAAGHGASGTNRWQNRRVSEVQLQWFPNGHDVLASVEQRLFVVHRNGKFDLIKGNKDTEQDPKLSPDGQKLLYRTGSDLFIRDLNTDKSVQLTHDGSPTLLNGELDWVYPEELDLGTATWWSPDSKRIAFLQFDVTSEFVYPQVDLLSRRAASEPERYPQSGTPNAKVRLGVITVDSGAVTWMNTGNDPNLLLARVAWLPDSSSLAVETAPRVQNALDLMLCDPASGKQKTIIHEHSKTWINIVDNLTFLKNSPEFLWTSERDGFRHIYRYSLNGELRGQVTSGQWEVSRVVAVDEPGKRILYTGSEDTPLETNLYTVAFSGGNRTRLTKPGFDHAIDSNEDGSFYLDRFSSLTSPVQTTLMSGDGKHATELVEADKSKTKNLQLQPTEIVKVPASDGATMYAQLVRPVGFKEGVRYPAIVEVYGGPGVQAIRNNWQGVNMAQVYAANGYVVWQMDNRGSTGRGHTFEEPIYHELGKQEVKDQKLGVEYLTRMGFVDPKRVGVTGWSYGGYMTIHCLLWAPETFRAGVAGAPVTDWNNYDTIYTERYMGLPNENPRGYEAASNVVHAARLQGPLLIEHNIEDDNVLFQNSIQMVNALEQAHKQYAMQIYPQKTHGVTGPIQKTLLEATLDFFHRNLQ